MPCEELPCIAFERLPGSSELPSLLREPFGWIIVTSPEAAAVFIDGWRAADSPAGLSVASVGGATAAVLEAAELSCGFVPSKVPAAPRHVAPGRPASPLGRHPQARA